MTTNEVIKGLECCKKGDCDGCPYKKYRTYGCDGVLREDALKHLQQQKGEVEMLQGQLKTGERYVEMSREVARKSIENAKIAAAMEIFAAIENYLLNPRTPTTCIGALSIQEYVELKKKFMGGGR